MKKTKVKAIYSADQSSQCPRYFNYQTITLPVPTNDTAELTDYALRATEKIYKPRCRFKKAGATFDDLVSQDKVQSHLFDQVPRPRRQRLMQTLDKINSRMTADTLRYAAAGLQQPWKTRFHQRSPQFTTNWNELPLVSAY